MKSKGLTRRSFFKSGFAAMAGACAFRPTRVAYGSEPSFSMDPRQNIIPAPESPQLWPEFRRQLEAWRKKAKAELRYSDELYRRPDFQWVTGNFSCAFLMLCDETFYDWRRGRYRVAQFLEEGRREFGGFDSVVLWHAYPRIGLDERNQFDFYRDMPGGLEGLRRAVRDFHHQRVKVFIDYNPWDTGTRRDQKTDLDVLCDLISALEADGIFLDTMDRGAAEFRAKLDAVRSGVILEGEGALPVERIGDHHASWAQHFDDSPVPGVLRNKWFERRHMQHQIRRWNYDHTSELHTAWMNGSGMLVWENVFGSWVGWSPRDRSFLRSMLPIQRYFAPLFCGEKWTPLVLAQPHGVYASLWEADGLRLWTAINRTNEPQRCELLEAGVQTGEILHDLMSGAKIDRPAVDIPARGLGCMLAAKPASLPRNFSAFLRSQSSLASPSNLSDSNPKTRTELAPFRRTRITSRVPQGMVEIGPASLELTIRMRNRECGFYDANPPENHNLWGSYAFSLVTFKRHARLGPFAIDLTPVTNRQFSSFLKAAKYQPRERHKFLHHWRGGSPLPGFEDHPVVYVGLEDARAYARWAGKRLPTEEEWQYAAQGTDGRQFPWGNTMEPGRCNGGEQGGTTPVTQFPEGRSPFGLYDMCGNVWHWTESERSDGRTRFAILRGGSFYSAKGSGWYMDGGPRPVDFAAKFLLMWPGLDRCSTIGFRCVVDL